MLTVRSNLEVNWRLRYALGMHEIPPIITERVDAMPLVLEQRQRLGLPALFDDHCPTHGTWQGLRLGWVSTIGLSASVSRGEPRLVHVEPWVGNRLGTLRAAPGHAVARRDGPAARLAMVRRWVHAALRWSAGAAARHPHTGRVSARRPARGHGESPSASADTPVRAHGLGPGGQSHADRPALPHVQGRQAGRDPLGVPRATEVVAGERAAAPLSVPGRRRGHARRGRHGLGEVGAWHLASRATRALLAAPGALSVGPLLAVPLAERAWAQALEAGGRGAHTLRPVGGALRAAGTGV